MIGLDQDQMQDEVARTSPSPLRSNRIMICCAPVQTISTANDQMSITVAAAAIQTE